MRFKKWLVAAAFAAALPCAAIAQTSPNLTKGQVLTAGQWNQLFQSKQDTLGFVPLNSAGGVMTGRLVTAAPGASTSGFNMLPGSAPASPADGDLWVTSSGLFARVNGVTIGPISGGTSASFGATSPITVSFPAGVVTYALNLAVANTWLAQQTNQGATTTSPGWYAQVAGDTTPRVRIGLNASDVASLGFGPGNAVRDLFIERAGAANARLGAPDTGVAVPQTLSVQNIAVGNTNAPGGDLTIIGSRGTGSAAGGKIIFQTAPGGSSGSSVNAAATALTISSGGGIWTGAASDPGTGNLNLAGGSLLNNGTSPTGTGAYVRATSPTVSGLSSSGLIVTSSFTATGLVTLADLVTGSVDTALGYWGGATASAIAVNNCSNALTYSTSTHTFGCNATAGTGNVVNSGTPTANQIAQWTNATTIQGVNLASLLTAGAGISITGTTSPTIALSLTNASVQAAPGTIGAIGSGGTVMGGLGSSCKITPVYSGRVRFSITGQFSNNTATAVTTVNVRYGTGTAPTSGAALTGAAPTTTTLAINHATINANLFFGFDWVVTGLTNATQYWFDVSENISAGVSTGAGISCSALEF